MPAFLSYAFFFRQKESVKKRTTKLSFHKPRPRQRDLTFLIQTTVFACLNITSAIKSRSRDNFSVTSILIVTAIFSVTENSSRAEFDSRFFSSQQPLRRLSRYAAQWVPTPLHRGGFCACKFSVHYQSELLDYLQIFSASARYTLYHTNIPNRLFQRSFTKNLTAPPVPFC